MLKKVISYIALIVLGFCFLLPFLIMILGSFKDVQFAQLDPLFWIPDQSYNEKLYIYYERRNIYQMDFQLCYYYRHSSSESDDILCSFRLYFCEETIPRARNRILGFHGGYHDSTATINYS